MRSWQSADGMRPEVRDLKLTADVKAWVAASLDKRLHHHTNGHQYMFDMQEYQGQRRPVMSCKYFSVEPNWLIVGPVLKVRLLDF